MATGVLILGESGHGKSTSIETLEPKETFIINVAGKPLPFKGWKTKYTAWNKENPTGNLYQKSNPVDILACMKYVNESRKDIKNLVIEDFVYMSTFEFFDRSKENGYSKFTDIGLHMKNVGTLIKDMRDDLVVYVLTHPDESVDIDGNRKITTKSIGKMVTEKLTFEGLFTVVLYAKARKGKDKQIEYGFETQTDGVTPAKSPKGMFEEQYIPNSLQFVKDHIIQYEN